jgi:hypothetical protein
MQISSTASSVQADTHFRAVCRALVAETLEFSDFLAKVTSGNLEPSSCCSPLDVRACVLSRPLIVHHPPLPPISLVAGAFFVSAFLSWPFLLDDGFY